MILDSYGRPLHRRAGFVSAFELESKPKMRRELVDAVGFHVPPFESDEDEEDLSLEKAFTRPGCDRAG